MIVRVFYDNGSDIAEFEYYSKYERINAKGINEEIEKQMKKLFGKRANYYVVKSYEMVNE